MGKAMPMNTGLRGRKLVLRTGTAMMLALAASQAQAQCSGQNVTVPGFNAGAAFVSVGSAAASNVQSLISVLTTTNTVTSSQNSGFIGAPANPAEGQQGGGVWARGLHGTFDTNTTGSYSFVNNFGLFAGNGSCKSRTFQDYSGFQVGGDISRLNIDGFNIHVGITAGYTESAARAGDPGSAGRANFESSFGGVYGAITKGTFFADAQLRYDFYQGQVGDPVSGINNQRLDARSTSIGANFGNQFPLADGFFVEPSAGIVYSQVTVDPLLVPGTLFLANNAGVAPPFAVQVQDFDSLLGRASLRFGKNMVLGDYALQPFFTASVFHEFSGAVRTSISTGFDAFGQTAGFPPGTFSILDSVAEVRSNRIGTYEQLAVGVAGQLLNTGWLGYARFDYRLGDRVDGYQISGGLRYQFNPDAAPAPLITKGDAPSVLPVLAGPVDWTGFSAGASVGGLFGQTHELGTFSPLDLTATQTVEPHTAGILAGGQVGADVQVGKLVFGVAGDFGWTNARGGRACPTGFGFFFSCQSNTDFMMMGTGRVGVTWERALFYAKGGAVFADVKDTFRDNTAGSPLIGGGGSFSTFAGTARDSLVGLTIGAGVEFALTHNWSAKAEYMHYEFEQSRLRFPTNVPILNPRADRDGDLVRVGVNYRFNFAQPSVVAASY